MATMPRSALILITAVGVLLVACGPASAPAGGPSGQMQGSAPAGRGLVAAVRVEPGSVATRALRTTGVALYLSKRLFNAELGILDGNAVPQPYLAEALPQLNTDSWQVFPDGRMETRYRLKPNLTWHDGVPLSTQDFVFARQVYSTPAITPTNVPFTVIEDVAAPDDRTLVIRWKQPYPDAGSLTDRDGEFPALPRHILDEAFAAGEPDAIVNNLFWTTAFTGLGPYRLTNWEPGAFIDAVAFDGHVLGRPKIPRVTILFVGDANSAIAKLAAGEVQLTADDALRTAQVPTVLQQWGPGGGSVVLHPNQWRSIGIQFRPQYASPRALMDRRVRQALAFAIEKQPINEAVYDGQAILADSMVVPTSDAGRAAYAGVVKFVYDPRRSEQLMAEAGFSRGGDGIYTSGADGRFSAEIKTNAASDNEAEISILARGWQELGFEVRQGVTPAAQAQDGQIRSSFSGMYAYNTGLGAAAARNLTTDRTPTPENRWQGGNYIGWSNPEFDRLATAYGVTLAPPERAQVLGQMAKLYSEELPAVSLFFRTQPWVHPATLRGPKLVPPEGNVAWNIYEWELQ
jgi:peptide/nickel transport system substrate-binding protein